MSDRPRDDMHVHESGALRSSVKPFYAEIPFESLKRVALRAMGAPRGEANHAFGFSYSGGAGTYGYGNWRKGLPLEDTFNHLIEHLYHWKESLVAGRPMDDDDLAAAAWAILFPLMTFEIDYRNQLNMRRRMIDNDTFPTPEQVDVAMRREFDGNYLLQPLSPEK